ncbi:uncharacterized protein LOC18429727 isoform X2 [Amborella trichopoda]|uniref:GMP synthase [glutamine-hydrolyzing] n=1 Tax=Amborella trichopoda TaxID=13333 RepID=W1NVH4_AMBTC|nr:uncharacterized protein LOC18429727 isoform X2 [Amborella trichopoda]ERN01642.1 hypothetical protein AMTR_s00090p00100220 [Amborella trichopoda]|eukprot:XP_006839073.1 uncharacterized protein LOC18429727 isoform X2 [Amborella trichopoda]
MDLESHKNTQVLILDFGSQYTHLITRRIRKLSVFSLCISGTSSLEAIAEHNSRVIILSGGPHSVHLDGAPWLPRGFFEYVEENGVFVLGICYGLQLIVEMLGGEVKAAKSSEYGRMNIGTYEGSVLFDKAMEQQVWMSHGDEVIRLPEGFSVIGRSKRNSIDSLKKNEMGTLNQNGVDCLHENTIAAIENPSKRIFGLQYHPEVTHSPKGMETLQYFLFEVCKVTADWELKDVLIDEIKTVNNEVGPEDHVICALSGGVDSTVAATIVHEAIGDRLHCVFVDNGLLRFQEKEHVMSTFQADLHLSVTCVDATDRFLSKLKGVVEPEMKRKIIGKEFISIFDDFAHELEQKLGRKPTFLVQGTLYPDVIESCPPPGSGRTHSHTIKSHHNVGGLPKDMKLKLIEPLKLLFKDEVRELGGILHVPQGFLKRHPFPGPGLAVRVIGDVTEGNVLDTLRQVDHIFVEAIKQAGIYDSIWQAFAVFPNIRTVGVQGDQRTHSHVVALRAITSEDGMTADWYNFDPKFLQYVSSKICNEVQGVNRVVYDITSKPPSTVEWE